MNMNISAETIQLSNHFRNIGMNVLMKRQFERQWGLVTQHSDKSFITDVDLEVEARLNAAVKITHPNVLNSAGEEEIAENQLPYFNRVKDKDVWIWDPVDGTGAMLEGVGIFAAVGQRIQRGVTIAGIIYVPGLATRNADGSLTPQKDMTFVAERGRGCWMFTGNDPSQAVRLTIGDRATSLKNKARVAFACRNGDKEYEAILAAGVDGYMERRHANHDYIRILTNEADATFYAEGLMPNGVGKCPPWDHAAGVLMIEEAGGYVALPYGEVGKGGQAYDPLQCHSSLLVAANRQLFDDMHRHIHARAPELCQPR